jgi:hypothetical protein
MVEPHGRDGSSRPLAQPLQLRHRTLRNRITFGAHTANMSEGGLPGDRHLDRPVHLVGDALAARLAVHAIYDGRLAGMRA